MRGEERRVDPPDGRLLGHGLGAVLAELEARRSRCGSGQAQPGQSKPSRLVQPQQRAGSAAQAHLVAGVAQRRHHRGQAGGGPLGRPTSSRSSPWSSVGAGFVIAAEPTQLAFRDLVTPMAGNRPQKSWQGSAPWNPSWRGRPGGRPRCTTGWSTSCPRRQRATRTLGIEGFSRVLRVPGRGHGRGVGTDRRVDVLQLPAASSCTTPSRPVGRRRHRSGGGRPGSRRSTPPLRRILGDDHPAAPETARAAELATTAGAVGVHRGPAVGGRPPRAGRARRAAPRPVVGHHRAARAPG